MNIIYASFAVWRYRSITFYVVMPINPARNALHLFVGIIRIFVTLCVVRYTSFSV